MTAVDAEGPHENDGGHADVQKSAHQRVGKSHQNAGFLLGGGHGTVLDVEFVLFVVGLGKSLDDANALSVLTDDANHVVGAVLKGFEERDALL